MYPNNMYAFVQDTRFIVGLSLYREVVRYFVYRRRDFDNFVDLIRSPQSYRRSTKVCGPQGTNINRTVNFLLSIKMCNTKSYSMKMRCINLIMSE